MKSESSAQRRFTFGRRITETTNGVKIGDLVSIQKNASFWNGEAVDRWYRHSRWYVTALEGNKAMLGKDETGKYKIRLPISTNFLEVVKSADVQTISTEGEAQNG